MLSAKGAKKEIDPEELLKRRFRAKCKFRAIGRLVLENIYWLIEGVDHYEGLEDVRRRVQQAVHGKVQRAKTKQLLSIQDKAILNKFAYERTDAERKYLYRIIGGLKCFKRYPNHVKKKLAAVTYFKYYGPGRVIVRQHHEAHALYFLVTGEVVVSHMVLDELLDEMVSVDIGTMYPGDMFGEVSLLHNIPRTATVTTNGHCELLVLMKEDFKSVLQASIQKQWEEVRRAMSAFTYFDALDEVARREGCIVAKMKSFEKNEVIYGDGAGVPNFVYFVLSGQCQMIETLTVVVTERLGQQYYTLYDPYVAPDESEQDFETKYKDLLPDQSQKLPERTSRASHVSRASRASRASHVSRISGASSGSQVSRVSKSSRASTFTARASASTTTAKARDSAGTDGNKLSGQPKMSSTSTKSLQMKDKEPSTDTVKTIDDQQLIMLPKKEERHSAKISVEGGEEILKIIHHGPPNTRTYFMQVCRFNAGSSFGFGESTRDRRVVALTPLCCMLLPRIWLLQRNTANIWTRIHYYLEKKIPTKKQLFAEFVSARRWQGYKAQLLGDVLARCNAVNWTSVHDVPYSIRMEEMPDI